MHRNLEMPKLIKLQEENYRSEISPPTLFVLNEFTSPFQLIVDMFDVPRYKEMNPALFTCVTFPFLFGVMFGDLCHGSVLVIAGVSLCIANMRIKNIDKESAMGAAISARYLITLMGIYSMYCGFLYNDFASIPLFFGSCYEIDEQNGTAQ